VSLPNDTLRADTLYLLSSDEPYMVVSGGTLKKNGQAFIGWRLGAGADGDLYVPEDDNAPHKTLTSLEDKAVGGSIDLYAVYLGDPCEGGVVFFDNKGTQWASDEWRFLVAAPSDMVVPGRLIHEEKDLAARFYFEKEHSPIDREFYSNILGTEEGIGTGKKNTELLYNFMSTGDDWRGDLTGSASYYGAAYVSGSKDDWFLPSIGELEKMYTYKDALGMTGVYWSSTQDEVSIQYVGDNSLDWNPSDEWLNDPEQVNYPRSQALRAWALPFEPWDGEWMGVYESTGENKWQPSGGYIPALEPGEPAPHSKNALHKVRPVRRF
jgi:hypothetical protein